MSRSPFPILTALVATAVLALSASGRGTSDSSANAAEPRLDAATAGLPSASPPADATEPAASPTAGETASRPRFGETFRYGGGLAVTVAEPESFRPAPWVDRRPGTPVRFEITVRNQTGDEWNPSQLHVRLLAAFAPATQIFDYDNDVIARPEGRVPDGKSAKLPGGLLGTGHRAACDRVSPGFGYQSITVSR